MHDDDWKNSQINISNQAKRAKLLSKNSDETSWKTRHLLNHLINPYSNESRIERDRQAKNFNSLVTALRAGERARECMRSRKSDDEKYSISRRALFAKLDDDKIIWDRSFCDTYSHKTFNNLSINNLFIYRFIPFNWKIYLIDKN